MMMMMMIFSTCKVAVTIPGIKGERVSEFVRQFAAYLEAECRGIKSYGSENVMQSR